DELRAQTRQAPLFDEKSKSALRARLAGAVMSINFDQFQHHGCRLKSFHKNIQRRSNGKTSRAHLSADKHVETNAARFLCRNPRGSLCCRVVMSTTPLPSLRESSAMARSCSARVNPLGIRMRIMNLPGVGRR